MHPLLRLCIVSTLAALPALAQATTVGPITELATAPVASQRAPALGWDGSRYLIVWEDRRDEVTNGGDLYTARILPDGTLLDTAGTGLLENSVIGGDQTGPSIAFRPGSNPPVYLIGWISAHNLGQADVFVTRFLVNDNDTDTTQSGTTLSSGGVGVTLGTDAESFPVVAATANSYLIAFQTVFVGVPGVSRVQARRLSSDGVNFLDAAAFNVVGPTAGSGFESGAALTYFGTDFIAAWEDDRNGNGDIFVRTIPDSGATVPVTPGTAIVSGVNRESSAAIGPLGIGNLGAVWHVFNGTDEDVELQRLTGALAPLGQKVTVSAANDDQRTPKIAGNDTGGLSVWQDRRNGSFVAAIYGSRLDASGTVLDPQGFPLLVFNQNAFEPAIVKGPGSDYLVAGVRFDTVTPRVFYRVVRDEVPVGAMTAMGNTMEPADGVTTMDLSFGPARGAAPDNLPVVDGTLYTVTVTDPNVEIVTPDVDATLPGHQIESATGEVFVQARTTAHIMADIMVTSVEGNSTGSVTVQFLNVAPVASNLLLEPDMPRSSVDLELSYDYFDVNSDPETGTLIQWLKNSAVQGQYTGLTVPAVATARGDQWRARVTPRDGLDFGTLEFSNTVVVGNSPPVIVKAVVRPDTDVRTGDSIEARYIFDDSDGDPEDASVLRWYRDQVEQTAFMDVLTVPGTEVVKGQSWYFTILPNDGFEDGELATSSTITVINTAPIAEAGDNDTILERRRYTLDGTQSSDIDPQDVLSYSWQQLDNGSVTVDLSSTSSPTPSFLAPSVLATEPLRFELIVTDGEESSPPSTVVVSITPVADGDGDRLDDEEEVIAGTDPGMGDTDRDGLTDYEEVVVAGTNPLDQDSDDDGVRDGSEGQTCRNCPPAPFEDPDEDTLINALDPDSDNDQIFDGTELTIRNPLQAGGTAPFEFLGTDESAGNFVADEDADVGTDPNLADTDGDTFLDGIEDANQNGRIDDGESDPNDPTDPGTPCTPGDGVCVAPLTCVDEICAMGGGGDGGLVCMPLDEALECCMGGCVDGTKVAPICSRAGAMESCPVGSSQCAANSCSDPTMPDPGDGGCGCALVATRTSKSGAWVLALLGGLIVFSRRRRG